MAVKLLTLVLATKNAGKVAELRSLLEAEPVEVLAVTDVLPGWVAPAETGATFEENAYLKARAVADATTLVTLADDSGLEVDALGGRPGVRSARFARDGATDAENNAALLTALSEVEDAGRTARFRCAIALVDPFGDPDKPLTAEGRCEGLINRGPRGESGFGYDPLFVVAGTDKTFAELGDAEKNRLSHRGKAVRAMLPRVRDLVAARIAEERRVFEARS